jgi:4-hydroxythreonine-4-phosphate dehydrogenase
MTYKIGISIGDAAGIGPEVILKALRDSLPHGAVPVVFGSLDVLRRENRLADQHDVTWPGMDDRLRSVDVEDRLDTDEIGVVDVAPNLEAHRASKGEPDPRCAELQLRAFHQAVDAAEAGHIDAIATAPWNKALFRTIDEPAVGHTDVLTDRFQTSSPVMMLAGPRLRVALATVHIPLRRVASRLTGGQLRTVVRTTIGGLRRRFGIERPDIAVCGLNPHAGEHGAIGDEEASLIEPTLEQLRQDLDYTGSIAGPFSPDTLFARFRNGATPFDAVVCMYHDQGLIPLKLMHFGESANVTLGLPIIRTSVDHGTGYDIAGEAEANAGSMRYALELAIEMARRSSSDF